MIKKHIFKQKPHGHAAYATVAKPKRQTTQTKTGKNTFCDFVFLNIVLLTMFFMFVFLDLCFISFHVCSFFTCLLMSFHFMHFLSLK